MPKQLVVILGMHRSGTSLIAKSIELFNYSLGDHLMPAGDDNPKGFWEDVDLVALNDKFLGSNLASWESPLYGDRLSAELALEFQNDAQKFLAHKLASRNRLAIKDPRMCVLMDFWSAQFARARVNVKYITVYRNPLDIAWSLAARDGMDIEHGLLLAYRYNRLLAEFLGLDAFVVDYGEFIAEPRKQLKRIGAYLEAPADDNAVSEFVDNFVDPDLCHHRHEGSDSGIAPVAGVSEAMLDLSSRMSKLSKDEPSSLSDHVEDFPKAMEMASRSLYVLQVQRDFKQKQRLTAHINELLAGRDQELLTKNQHIRALKIDVEDLVGDVARANEVLAERGQDLLTKNQHIHALKIDVEDLVGDVARASEVLAERDRELLTKNQHIQALKVDVDGLVENIAQANEVLAERDRELHHLRDVLTSVSFRLGRALTYPLRKPITKFVLPALQGSPAGLALIRLLRTCLATPVNALKLMSWRRIQNFFLLMTRRRDLIRDVSGNYQVMLTDRPDDEPVQAHRIMNHEKTLSKLRFTQAAEPVVSVVIPVYNQIDYTLRCLESIHQHLPKVPIEIIVADDCSTDATQTILERIEGIRIIRQEENLGFLRSCNRAVEFCQGEFVCLLNNDTLVKPEWLDALVQTLRQNHEVGLVGSKLLYPDGSLQEAGGIIWQDGSGWNYGRHKDPEAPEYNYLREVDYVSGAAILFPRQLFFDAGRFDEQFAPAYYEDTDLAFTIRHLGKKVMFQPRSLVVHFEGQSHGTHEQAGVKKHQIVNREKFRKKWQDVLDSKHWNNETELYVARERAAGKTKVLVIDHHIPCFDQDAGSRSTYQYLKLLVKTGCNVKFIGDNYYRHEPYTSALQAMGIEVLYGNYYQKNWKRWIRSHSRHFDVIYLMRPHIAERYIDVINKLNPRPRTIYFGHDLHYLRLRRQYELEKDRNLLKEMKAWEKKELALFSKFDVVYYPSQVEVDEIRSRNKKVFVKAIPLYVFEEFNTVNTNFLDRHGLLFVGGYNHPPNTDGLKWFVDRVFPRITERFPDLQLHVVGSNMPKAVRESASEKVLIRGFLSDKELDALYQQVRLSVVPLRFGAGVKGKVLEALLKGVPVVTTDIGAEGIPDAAEVMRIANGEEKMAQAVMDLYEDTESLGLLSHKGREMVRRNFSPDAALKVIAEDFLLKASCKIGTSLNTP